MPLLQSAVIFLLVLIITTKVTGISLFDDEEEVEQGNKYIDDLLKEMVYEKGHEYDPYLFEDSQASFTKKVIFFNVSAEAKLHNGYMTGLKSLHRPYDCFLQKEDNDLLVSAELGAGVLTFNYDGTVKFMHMGPTINVHGELAYVETHMEFIVDANTGRDGTLTKFYIDDFKGMKIEITGLGPMNWILNYLISWTASIFEGYLRGVIENKVRDYIAARLPHYQFPVTEINKNNTMKTFITNY